MLTTRQNHVLQLLWLSQTRSWLRHQVPLLGSIIAGKPESATEGRMDGCIDIDPATLRLPKNARTFALKVRGDSMRNAAILERIPAGRWGAPEDLGGPVVFLASKASDYVNGYTIAVDGGWLAR